MSREIGKGTTLQGHQDILGGLAHIYQMKVSGEIWQFRMWLSVEKKLYRKSLRTKSKYDAIQLAEKLAIDLRVEVGTGKKLFGITIEELMLLYIDYREKDIGDEDGQITYQTWRQLPYKLNTGSEMLGLDTKVSSVKQGELEDYRQRRISINSVGVQTILNEQAQLNAMWEFGYKKGHSTFRRLEFKKLRLKSKAEKKRSTFTDEQYRKLYTFTGNWAKEIGIDKDEILKRKMIHDMILVLSNTALRIGECRQLRWGHLSDEQTLTNEKTDKSVNLVYIKIPKLITKVRVERSFFTHGREYFDRLRERQEFTNDTHLIFSMNGTKSFDDKEWGRIWKVLMVGIGINHHFDEGYTWYSLRHFAISKKIQSGISVIDLSQIVGTSVANIENVYLDYTKVMSKNAALQTFKRNVDGTTTQIRRDEL